MVFGGNKMEISLARLKPFYRDSDDANLMRIESNAIHKDKENSRLQMSIS